MTIGAFLVVENGRLAKNTLLLYVRMIITLMIMLYTSRVVLRELGVQDFGIYNVVGGVVVIFTFLNGAMTTATQRFLNFALAKNERIKLQEIFCTSINVHFLVAVIIIIIGELIGLWGIDNLLNIPVQRLSAANWVYQFSLFSISASVITIPYNAAIIAHERMGAFAYISILDSCLKLIVVLSLGIFSEDKLKVYALLIFITTMIIRIVYIWYCNKYFKETNYRFFFDKKLFYEIISFAGWNLLGNVAVIGYSQGINVMLNIFYGPAINASRALAFQVQSAVSSFSSSFQLALNPQITKKYAIGDYNAMHELVYFSSKLSLLLLFALSLPIILETPYILSVWLVNIPEDTDGFVRIILIITIIEGMANPLMVSAQATGKIRNYQLAVGGVLLLIVPVAYISLTIIDEPIMVFYIQLFMAILAQCLRLLFVNKMVGLSVCKYLKKVVFPCAILICIASIIPLLLHFLLPSGFKRVFLISLSFYPVFIIACYFICFNKIEQKQINKIFVTIKKKIISTK